MRHDLPRLIAAIAALGIAAAMAGPLSADGLTVPPVKDPLVAKECSACHMLYPPGLLPARSWKGLTDGLKTHFGDNAELSPEAAAAVADYLQKNAADAAGRRSPVVRDLPASATPLRITELPWFKYKHEKRDRISPATLKRRGAKFAGDCIACHKGADKGLFDEDDD